MKKFTPRKDNEWFRVSMTRGHLIACCDCGLVHHFKFKLAGSRLTMMANRQPRLTAARRRWEKPTLTYARMAGSAELIIRKPRRARARRPE